MRHVILLLAVFAAIVSTTELGRALVQPLTWKTVLTGAMAAVSILASLLAVKMAFRTERRRK